MYANKTAAVRAGYDMDELLGADLANLIAETEDKNMLLEASLKDGGWNGETSFKSKSGENFPVMLSTSLISDGRGRPIAIIGIWRCIVETSSAWAQKEEQQHGQELLAQYLVADVRGLAHDLANVVAVIIGRAQLLQMAHKKEDLLEGLETIENAAKDCAEIVRRLRELAAPRNVGKFPAVDLSERALEAVDATR